MNARTSISAYTPSNTDPRVLERILVQREKLLGTVVRQMKKSMSSGNKHHVLLSGPRGSGKTYFLTLVHFRLTQDPSLADSMRIAWLGEDAVITSLIDLALEMADQLAAEYPEEFNAEIRGNLQSLPPDDAAEAIFKDIAKRLGNRNLLLMMENLDRTFQGLREGGQKKWRAFLQETRKTATLATTQQLFDGVSKRDEAFFGFFDIHHLQPLSFEDALQLIRNVARETEKQDLVDFLDTSEGHFRIRALRHLAGGNHRMYIMLAEFLTKETLDELVGAFEQLAEELTPYFQERLRSLPPQQARIVQSLCNAEGALTVKAVAAETFLPYNNCTKLLGELKKKCYVVSKKRGKDSYYEMAEPLMRLCLELKSQRGRPLRLIALFLRAWFPAQTLQSPENAGLLTGTRSDLYRTLALNIENGFEDAVKTELNLEIDEKTNAGKYDEALELADELHHANPAYSLSEKVTIHRESGKFDDARSCLNELKNLPGLPKNLQSTILLSSAIISIKEERFELALNELSSFIENPNAPLDLRQLALVFVPVLIIPTGSWADAMEALAKALDEVDPSAEYYGGIPDGLLKMVLRKGHAEWGVCAADLMRIYRLHDVSDKLCGGLVTSIAYLDEGDYSDVQLDAWNKAWQEAGEGDEACEVALQCLEQATQAIKTHSDRPLFKLPQEVREIVLPLLQKTCGGK